MGPHDDPATKALLRVAHGRYLPNRALAGADSAAGVESPTAAATSPLLEDRDLVDGKPAAYVCENYACQLPVTDPDALAAQLDS